MHEYSLSYHDRKKIYYFLVVLSTLVSIPIGFFIKLLSINFDLMLVAPSGFLVFFLIFQLFDKYLWKIPFMYTLSIIKIPNLNGKWIVTMHSSKEKEDIKAKVNITQTYSKIKIRLTTELSTSVSTMANIEMIDSTYFQLRYEYSAEFQKNKNSEILRHYGVTSISLESENEKFNNTQKAFYYTGLSRNSSGNMSFKRKEKND